MTAWPIRYLGLPLLICCFATGLMAQRDRIAGAIDSARRAPLHGHVHPLARPEFDRGPVDSLALEPLTLMLKPSADQETELDRLLAAQQDPSSPEYHVWLTPEQYADRFGASPGDVGKISQWLEQQGFQVTTVARGRNWISFDGTASQVASAFGAEIHRFEVNGEMHFANITEPSVPSALGAMVQGIRGLHDFRARPLLKPQASAASPAYTSAASGNHYLSPDDLATIYNIKSLYASGIDGSGQKLAVAGQTQINLSDIEQYRTQFNLSANDPQVVLVPGTRDPGISSNDLPEADLDLELSGAVAPNATVIYVYSSDVMASAQYAIDQNLAPVLSISYGSCEPETPTSDALTFQSWARQGNAQGITWIAASGDSGGADCISSTSTTDGVASVDVPASIPEVTGLGGTEFSEGNGQFWNATNNVNGGSALGYIPEIVWNDSNMRDPAAGGGGASVLFLKPTWQTGAGVPNDNARDVPDVSLSASANHDGYMVYTGGKLQIYGGTSVAAPSFAGIAALLNQYLVTSGAQASPGLGNMNPKLYGLGQTAPTVFHDITLGNNIVAVTCGTRSRNCVSGAYGFSAGPGYDLASGLGSVDAHALVTTWSGQSGSISRSAPSMTLASSAGSILSSASAVLTAVVRSSNGGTPSGTVSFFFGNTALGSAPLAGSGGAATGSVTASGGQLPLGSDTITAQYSGDISYSGATASITVNVTSSASAPPAITALTNGASFRQAYAPGMVLSIFGTGLAPSAWSASTLPLPAQLAGVSVSINGIDAPLYYVSPSQLNVQVPYETPANAIVSLQVINNGQTASGTLTTRPAAPGIFTDATGAVVPTKAASAGQVISVYITGQGAVAPSIATGAAPPPGTSVGNLPIPLQAATVTVGNAQAQIQFIGIPTALVGVTQINLVVPSGLAKGVQPVVVAIGGVASPPASLTIQ